MDNYILQFSLFTREGSMFKYDLSKMETILTKRHIQTLFKKSLEIFVLEFFFTFHIRLKNSVQKRGSKVFPMCILK